MRNRISLAIVFGITLTTACVEKKDLYKDASQPIEKRVENLLSQMTLDEKIAQFSSVYLGRSQNGDNASFTQEQYAEMFKNGIGQVCQPGKRRSAEEIATFTNEMQKFLIEKTRLGIPAIMHEEGLHGMIANGVTIAPTPIALSCSWNEQMMKTVYDKIGKEMRSVGIQLALSPVLDVARDPRWGRFEETFGEDPYLVSRMGVSTVQGFQGEGDFVNAQNVIATGKHFCGYAYPESGTNVAPSLATERELYEIHFKPFHAAIKEAKMYAIMASYNELSGIPSHANKWLLKDILRDTMGFQGLVVADYGGVQELMSLHHVAADASEAATLAFNAGVDYDLPNNSCYKNLTELISSGKVLMSDIDKLTARVLTIKFQLGLFDNPYVDVQKAVAFVGDSAGNKLMLETAHESMVLLKNESNSLPLDIAKIKTIAVVGPNADRTVLGAYYGTPKYTISPLQGIKNYLGNDKNILYAEGCLITREFIDSVKVKKINSEDPDKYNINRISKYSTIAEDAKSIAEAVATARKSDVVILCVGGDMSTTGEAFLGVGRGDRANLELSPSQKELFNQLYNTGKKVVVLLLHGGPIADMELFEKAAAIIDCHYLGQETGTAIANVLFGDVNPSGKLSYSIPRSAGHVPAFYNYKPTARRGYGYAEISPAFPFGYGLSYTNFSYTNFKLSKDTVNANEQVTASVEVTNTGTKDGKEVVQMYIRDVYSSVTRPVKELKGFKKINLKAGEKQTVEFVITHDKLSFYDKAMKLVVEPGLFEVMIGSSSDDKDLQKKMFYQQ